MSQLEIINVYMTVGLLSHWKSVLIAPHYTRSLIRHHSYNPHHCTRRLTSVVGYHGNGKLRGPISTAGSRTQLRTDR